MTQVRLRQCHKCSKKFFKSDGCNKMTCSCGASICYICRKDISADGYQHFCNISNCTHVNCGGCQLYYDPKEDDKQAMRDAALVAMGDGTFTGGGGTKDGGVALVSVKFHVHPLNFFY